MENVDEGFACFVDVLAIGLERNNVGDAFVGVLAAVFNRRGHKLNFKVGIFLFKGFLYDVVDPVTIVNPSMHVADESGGDHIIRRSKAESANPDVVVPEPHKKVRILLHYPKSHRACYLNVENDGVVLGVVTVVVVTHFFHVVLDFFFTVRDVRRLGDRASRRSVFSWEEVKRRVDFLVLDQELDEDGLDAEGCVVIVFTVYVDFGLELEFCDGTFVHPHGRRSGRVRVDRRESGGIRGDVIHAIVRNFDAVHRRQKLNRN